MTRNPARIHLAFIRISLLAVAAILIAWAMPFHASAGNTPKRATHSTRRHYRRRYRRYRGVPTYMPDPAAGDDARFDDPVVRQAALDALGRQNGSVVAVDPTTGRVLTIVNQRLAYSSGFEPCSSLKPIIAVAALEKGVVTPDSMIRVGGRRYMDMTEALAHSNNNYFQELGRRLGFPTVWHYDHIFGLGARVGYDIPGEQPGFLPATPPRNGGVERMCSFGEGIRLTPLQLASVVSTIANGGTIYYLQYPQTAEAVRDFVPRVRRRLAIAPMLPELRQGMLAAVLYGTARFSNDPEGEQTLGKTGTCDDETKGGRLGWFGSYADQNHPKLVLVILLRGEARIVSGPHAADVAGKIYQDLYAHNYFADKSNKTDDQTSSDTSMLRR